MQDILRSAVVEIGYNLERLGQEMRIQDSSGFTPLNFHGHIKDTIERISFTLNVLNASLYKWRNEIMEKTDRSEFRKIFNNNPVEMDIETIYIGLNWLYHLLYVDKTPCNGETTSFIYEIEKLEWLLEELKDTPNVLRKSKISEKNYCFLEITGER